MNVIFDDPNPLTGSLRCAWVDIAARRLNYCAQEAMAESVLYKKLWYNTKVLVEADDRSQ